jgi:hypothetical protein
MVDHPRGIGLSRRDDYLLSHGDKTLTNKKVDMKNLGALSEEELEALIAHVEAEKPWSGGGYHMIVLIRRFMLSLWVGALACALTYSNTQFITWIIPALLFDFYITPKADDMQLTIRSIIQRYHDTWCDEGNDGCTNSRPIFKNWRLLVWLMLVYALVWLLTRQAMRYYENADQFKCLMVMLSIFYVAFFSRYGATFLILVDTVYQDIFRIMDKSLYRGSGSFEEYHNTTLGKVKFSLSALCLPLLLGFFPIFSLVSFKPMESHEHIFDYITFSICASFAFILYNVILIFLQRVRLSLVSYEIYKYYGESLPSEE